MLGIRNDRRSRTFPGKERESQEGGSGPTSKRRRRTVLFPFLRRSQVPLSVGNTLFLSKMIKFSEVFFSISSNVVSVSVSKNWDLVFIFEIVLVAAEVS